MRWLMGYHLTYPVSCGCLAVAKLLVLDRLMAFSSSAAAGMSFNCAHFGRAVIGLIFVGSVLGLCGNIVASVFFARAAGLYDAAAAAKNSTDDSSMSEASTQRSTGQLAGTIHLFFETTMLLLIVIGLTIGGIASARKFRSAIESMDLHLLKLKGQSQTQNLSVIAVHEQSSLRQLQIQVYVTCSFMFVSFLLRALHSTMFAVAGAFNNNSVPCLDAQNQKINDRCSTCYNVFAHVNIWLLYSPAFFWTVYLISEPIALLVALWGMTAGRTWSIMSGQKDGSRNQPSSSRTDNVRARAHTQT
jgi:hypothetical protein